MPRAATWTTSLPAIRTRSRPRCRSSLEVGINHLLVRFLGEWPGKTRGISEDSMRLFAREVLPRFKHIPPLTDPLALDLRAAS